MKPLTIDEINSLPNDSIVEVYWERKRGYPLRYRVGRVRGKVVALSAVDHSVDTWMAENYGHYGYLTDCVKFLGSIVRLIEKPSLAHDWCI